jgi:tellurite resistance protein TerC
LTFNPRLIAREMECYRTDEMDMATHSMWAWVGFCAFILIMLLIDLGLFNRKAHSVTYKEAAVWSIIWVTLAMIFAGIVFSHSGTQKGLEFLTGYLIELSLSVDNLFVFLLIFAYFKVPTKYQHRVLFWGVLGALVMRVTMILVGAALIERFGWIIYIFGAFLVYTGLKMFRQEETEVNPEQNFLVRIVTRYIPITRHYEGENFFTRVNGRRNGTLLLLVLVIVEVTDLVFAVDSIPAIFAITRDRFILYTSNVFAILGLRSLFFLLAGVVEKFHYLKVGLAIVLSFIGIKMLLPLIVKALILVFNLLGAITLIPYAERVEHIPIGISLGVVAVVLLGSVAASLIWPQHAERDIDIDLPPDFGRPFEDVEDTDTEMTGTSERR